jgi:DNA helicase HerA-like ATPase
MLLMSDSLGILVGRARPDEVTFESKRSVSIGEYVILEYGGGGVLGLIERSSITSGALGDDIGNYEEAVESRRVAAENRRDKSYKGTVRILGYLESLKKGRAMIPPIPPEPGTEVFEATTKDLVGIFSPTSHGWIKAGTLLRNPEVEVGVNINKVVSRHLAILAMTGMGKSNLVSLLTKEISGINGTMVVFDYHEDYTYLDIPNSNRMDARINPRFLTTEEFAEVIEIQKNASNQLHVLRVGFTDEVKKRKDDDFWNALIDAAIDAGKEKGYREASEKVVDKIQDAKRRFSRILDAGLADPLALLKNGKINIINLVELTERQANIVVSYFLQELLEDRKKGRATGEKDPRFVAPVLAVIEEAHVFIPKGEDTETKYYASKVAREGRKFGLGLVIVSQRPRSLDANILSQMGSLAVMRMIQQDDQAQVASASEALSEDLIEQLTSLNSGEAIFAGQWVNLPAFVRIEEVKDRKTGVDLDAVEQWKRLAQTKEMSRETSESYIPSGYSPD